MVWTRCLMRTGFIFLVMMTMLADRSNADIQIVWIPVGGPDLDDPIIIRRVPHTYHYPDGTGCLTLRENSFYMEAPMPLQPIRAKGTLELLPNQNMRYGILDPERGWIGPIDFVWIGDTLKVENFEYSYSWRIVWYLYWVRQTDKRRQS